MAIVFQLNIQYQNNGLPQVITGIRRCGKSYLLREIFRNYLLGNYVRAFCNGKGNCYVFLDEIQRVFSTATGALLNSEKIAHTFKSVKHEDINKQTIEKYISYFKEAFILSEARRYDLKGRAEIGALRKYYFCDTGLRNARLNFAFPDEGQMLENIVYNELIYNDYSVNIGTFDSIEKNQDGKSIRKTNEIDFYAVKGNRQYYIQVCAEISDVKTREREVRPYVLLNDQIQKIVVINKPINECRDEGGFTIIGISDFLLRFIK